MSREISLDPPETSETPKIQVKNDDYKKPYVVYYNLGINPPSPAKSLSSLFTSTSSQIPSTLDKLLGAGKQITQQTLKVLNSTDQYRNLSIALSALFTKSQVPSSQNQPWSGTASEIGTLIQCTNWMIQTKIINQNQIQYVNKLVTQVDYKTLGKQGKIVYEFLSLAASYFEECKIIINTKSRKRKIDRKKKWQNVICPTRQYIKGPRKSRWELLPEYLSDIDQGIQLPPSAKSTKQKLASLHQTLTQNRVRSAAKLAVAQEDRQTRNLISMQRKQDEHAELRYFSQDRVRYWEAVERRDQKEKQFLKGMVQDRAEQYQIQRQNRMSGKKDEIGCAVDRSQPSQKEQEIQRITRT